MSMTLRDLVARGTPLDWFESVAIVQELAAAVQRGAGPEGPRVPDLPGAELLPDGTVEIGDAGSGDQAPVFRLAHVLNALLTTASPPVQLRLLVLTALSPEPSYKTVAELSQALEYFERPDRRDVVRRIYERASKLPAPALEGEVAPLPDKPEPKPEKPKEPKQAASWTRQRLLLAVALPAAVALVGGGWWWSTRPAGARVLETTTQLVSKAVTSAVETVRTRLGSGEPVAAASTVEPTPAPEPKAARRAKPRFARPLRPARSLAQNALPAPLTLAPSVAPGTWPPSTEPVDEVIVLDLGAAATTGSVPPIYTLADTDVRPPVAVRPRLPSEPPPGVPLQDLTRLEVLVSVTGEVDSVKIVAGPRTSLDGMMLSAVKAWQFRPATKDGRPVAYRHQVWLTNR